MFFYIHTYMIDYVYSIDTYRYISIHICTYTHIHTQLHIYRFDLLGTLSRPANLTPHTALVGWPLHDIVYL